MEKMDTTTDHRVGCEDYHSEVVSLRAQIVRLANEDEATIASLRAQLAEARSTIEAQHAAATANALKMGKDISGLAEDNARLASDLAEAQRERDAARADLAEQRALTWEAWEREAEAAEADVHHLVAFAEVRRQRDAARAEGERLRAQVKDLQALEDHVSQSRDLHVNRAIKLHRRAQDAESLTHRIGWQLKVAVGGLRAWKHYSDQMQRAWWAASADLARERARADRAEGELAAVTTQRDAYRSLLMGVVHEALMAEHWHMSSVRVAKTPALSLGAATSILRDVRHGLEALEGCTLVEADERWTMGAARLEGGGR